MSEFEDLEVLAEGLSLPEGPVALADGSVIVGEIGSGALSRVFPDGRIVRVAYTGGGPNGVARGPDGAFFVCNNGGVPGGPLGTAGIQRVDIETGAVEMMYETCDGVPFVGPNDIVVDEIGNFWFTDYKLGSIYYGTADGNSVRLMWDRLDSPNGIGLSPDNRILYSSQTHTRQVVRRHISSPGELVPSRNYDLKAFDEFGEVNPDVLLAGLSGGQELDSLAIDGNGAVCVATLIETGINVIGADGVVQEKLTLPADRAEELDCRTLTNICFGGDDLRTAFITLSHGGRLISCRWPVPGLRLNFQEG